MSSDIVLKDNAIEFIEAEHVSVTHNGRSIEIDLQPNARIEVGSAQHRGVVMIRGRGARLSVPRGAVTADDLSAKDQVRIGRHGEGGTSPGRLRIQGRNGAVLEVDGNTGKTEIEGVGDLAQRMAELTLLREQVRRLEQRVRALETGSS
jgi:hypothetical protein